MKEVKFTKTVSKGSRFNQVYIPVEMAGLIEAGDEVEVRLIRKQSRLFYSGLKKVSDFKERLIQEVFSFIMGSKRISAVFAVGSFIYEKADYNDIDIVIITKDEKDIREGLVEKFGMKFHLIPIEETRFEHLLKICPLTRSMFSTYIGSVKITVPEETIIDKTHLKFLLMMPYDLLEINAGSRAFFDSLRRLMTIERFLIGKSLKADEINHCLKDLLKKRLYEKMRNNEELESGSISLIRSMIKSKLELIENLLKNGKK